MYFEEDLVMNQNYCQIMTYSTTVCFLEEVVEIYFLKLFNSHYVEVHFSDKSFS